MSTQRGKTGNDLTPHEAYYRGVADALDAIREYEFPYTKCVDFVAAKLAPASDEVAGDVR